LADIKRWNKGTGSFAFCKREGASENQITHYHKNLAAALMAEAVSIARASGCYKVSLTTGNKDEGTFRFYEGCGFNREDKTALIRWF